MSPEVTALVERLGATARRHRVVPDHIADSLDDRGLGALQLGEILAIVMATSDITAFLREATLLVPVGAVANVWNAESPR